MYKDDVRINASTIFNLLAEKGALSFNEICEFTDFKEPLIFMALGWLLKEEKVRIFEHNDNIYIEFIQCYSEFYF